MAASSGTTVHEGLAIVTGAGWLTFFQVCRWGLRLLCANQGLHSRQTLSRKVGIVVYIACQDLGKLHTVYSGVPHLTGAQEHCLPAGCCCSNRLSFPSQGLVCLLKNGITSTLLATIAYQSMYHNSKRRCSLDYKSKFHTMRFALRHVCMYGCLTWEQQVRPPF